MLFNEIPIEQYKGMLGAEYFVTSPDLDTQYSSNGQFPILHAQRFSLKTIQLPITFFGYDSLDAYRHFSAFCQAALGTNELTLPDGAGYRVLLTAIGQETYLTEGVMDATFTFIGAKHGPKQIVVGRQIYCESTAIRTDCRITVPVTAAGTDYVVGSVKFYQVKAGEVLTVDGIRKRILVNGAPAAERAEWMEFPYLKPGYNEILCKDEPTTEFWPGYF